MADNTSIEWADATCNAVNGCTVISPGCANCYAMRAGGRNLPGHPSTGLTQPSKAGHVWTGEVRLSEKALLQPLRWTRPRKIFWNAHGDLFHKDVPVEWIDKVIAVCALTPQHTHMILTKRSPRMRRYFLDDRRDEINAEAGAFVDWRDMADASWPLPNLLTGVSVEDQDRADERILDLVGTPAALRFISAEPLLGPLPTLSPWLTGGDTADGKRVNGIDWVIVGSESGKGARPMKNEWAQSIVDQCQTAGVPVLVKQISDGGPKAVKDISLFPPSLQVREFPA